MVEYLSGGRIQGTDVTTREKILFPDAFLAENIDGNTNASQPYTTAEGGDTTQPYTPIFGQDSMYFDASDAQHGAFNSYLGNLQEPAHAKIQWSDLGESDWTLAFWLRYNTNQGGGGGSGQTGTGSIIGTVNPFESGGATNEENGFYVALDDGGSQKFMVHMASDDTSGGVAFDEQLTDAIALNDDKWHHYVFLFNNTPVAPASVGVLKIYRDGVLRQTLNYANEITDCDNTTWNGFDMGRSPSTNGRLLKEGYLCDVMVFKRILETSEISALFNGFDPTAATSSSNTGKNLLESGISTAGCKAWWKMNAIIHSGEPGFSGNSVPNQIQIPISDIPAGTRLEVTDTRKIYQFNPSSQGTNLNEDDNITFNKGVGVAGYGYEFAANHAIVGTSVTSVWFKMQRSGTQSAGVLGVYAGQSASTGNNTLIGSVNASSLPTSYDWVEFTGTPYTLLSGDKIWIKVSTECTVNNAIRYFSNAAGGYVPAPSYQYWGAETPTEGETLLGTHDLGGTFSLYRTGSTVSDADVPPARDGSTTGHPVIIKIDYAKVRWAERGTA